MSTQYTPDAVASDGSSEMCSIIVTYRLKTNVITGKMVFDSAVSDYALHYRARVYLDRLGQYSTPTETSAEITTQSIIEALYETAAALKSPRAARYISSEICAVGGLVDQLARLLPHDPQPESIVSELGRLATGWAQFFVILARLYSCMTPEWASALAPTAQPSVLSKILARDGNKCFKSGLLYKDSAGLCATPIIPSSLQLVVESLSLENAPSSLGADLLRFLANFCELDVSDVDTLHGPENRLLLDAVEGLGFAHLEWTLLPTEIPNQYKVATFTDPPAETPCNDPNVPEQGREKDTYVTFVDHSTSAPRPSVWARLLGKQAPAVPGTGIPLPSPDFLRVHATTALFMHHAGFKGSKLYPGL